jgi:hypothetical protein
MLHITTPPELVRGVRAPEDSINLSPTDLNVVMCTLYLSLSYKYALHAKRVNTITGLRARLLT